MLESRYNKQKYGLPQSTEADKPYANYGPLNGYNNPTVNKNSPYYGAAKSETDLGINQIKPYADLQKSPLENGNNFGQMQSDATNTLSKMSYDAENAIEPTEEKGINGSQATALAGAGITFASQIKASIDMDAEGVKEENANVANMAMQGATFGATVGSVIPGVGTLIGGAGGALIGAGIGYASKGADRRKFTKKKNLADQKFLSESIANREQQSRIEDGEAEIGKLKSLYKANIGLS